MELIQQKIEAKKEHKEPEFKGFEEGLSAPRVEVVEESHMVEEASAEAENIIQKAGEEAEAIIQNAKSQEEQIFQQAVNKGMEDAAIQTEQKLQEMQKQLEMKFQERTNQLEEEYQVKYQTMEKDLVETILSVFEKVFHMQLTQQKDILIHLIENTLLHIEAGTRFTVYVSPGQYQDLSERSNEIVAQTGKSIEIKLLSDPGLSMEQCRIESDYGIFPCGIDVHYQNLVKQLKQLSE